jgi:hypothetical protein
MQTCPRFAKVGCADYRLMNHWGFSPFASRRQRLQQLLSLLRSEKRQAVFTHPAEKFALAAVALMAQTHIFTRRLKGIFCQRYNFHSCFDGGGNKDLAGQFLDETRPGQVYCSTFGHERSRRIVYRARIPG